MNTTYQLQRRRPGSHYCFRSQCSQYAIWKGVVAGTFNAGRACEEHKEDLAAVARAMARDWQPCCCPDACGR